jgi:hypothetical protein
VSSSGRAFDPELTPLFILMAERLFATELVSQPRQPQLATLASFRRVPADA